jgi:hypothetical protein
MSHFDSPLASLDYPEPPPPIWRGLSRGRWLDHQRGVQKIANRPRPLCNAERHGRRGAQGLN